MDNKDNKVVNNGDSKVINGDSKVNKVNNGVNKDNKDNGVNNNKEDGDNKANNGAASNQLKVNSINSFALLTQILFLMFLKILMTSINLSSGQIITVLIKSSF